MTEILSQQYVKVYIQ